MRILVTGGCGFIGSHIVDSLCKKGAQVTVLDDLSSGYRENLEDATENVNVVRGNITDYRKLSKVCKGVDLISHQAAQLEITKSLEDPVSDLSVNTAGSLNVFNAAVRNGVERIIYASSAGVYGEAQHLPQDETHPTNPNWPYGVSKLAVEKYADIYSKYHGIATTGLRYSIVYGPREWYGRVLTLFLKRALKGKPPVVWGGDQVRDFVYVSDVVSFHDRLIDKGHDYTGVFNVSSGVGTKIRDLADLVVEAFDLEEPIYESIREGEMSKAVPGRKRLPLELKKMILDNSKAKKIGWQPKIGLKQGLQKELDWARENPNKWEKMRY